MNGNPFVGHFRVCQILVFAYIVYLNSIENLANLFMKYILDCTSTKSKGVNFSKMHDLLKTNLLGKGSKKI